MFKDETFKLENLGTSDTPDLVLEYKTRLKLEMKCEMEYSRFPFDQQTCNILLASMRELGTQRIHLRWNNLGVTWVKEGNSNPAFDIEIEQFNKSELGKLDTYIINIFQFVVKFKFRWQGSS